MLEGAKKAPFSLIFRNGIGFELLYKKKLSNEQNNYLQPIGNDGKNL